MGDDVAPYSGAIEETAKTAGKALDLVRDGAGPIADIYGLIIGDQIHAARHRRLDSITRKTRQILNGRHLSETAEIAEQIAIPLLEAAQGEPREEMQDLWARLLANAMDPSRRNDVRPEFIQTLKSLHPIDALILEWLGKTRANGWVHLNTISEATGIRKSSVVVTVSNLTKYECCRSQPRGENYVISEFGEEFLRACNP
jgi:hypothetical protein